MTALKNQLSSLWVVGVAVVVTYIIFQIVFHRGSIADNVLFTVMLWWLFLPGVVFFWKYDIELIEKLVFGAILGSTMSGTAMYFLGLFGVQLSVAVYLGPLLLSALSAFLVYRARNTKQAQQ